MDQCDIKIHLVKYMWVSDTFHGPLILPSVIVIVIHLEMAPAGGILAPPGTCSSYCYLTAGILTERFDKCSMSNPPPSIKK